MRSSGFLPSKIFIYLYATGHQFGLSYKEVEISLLRWAMEQFGEPACDHPRDRIKFSKTKKKPYCSDCYTRLRTMQVTERDKSTGRITYKTDYIEERSFIDVLVEETERDRIERREQEPDKGALEDDLA